MIDYRADVQHMIIERCPQAKGRIRITFPPLPGEPVSADFTPISLTFDLAAARRIRDELTAMLLLST